MSNQSNNPLSNAIKFCLFWLLALVFVCGGGFGLLMIIPDIHCSDGERYGVITKLSHKGIFWKTWEGEMCLGGTRAITNTDGQSSLVSNVWSFSVINHEIIDQIKEIMADNGKCGVTYIQVINPKPWNGKTGYYITSVTRSDH